MKCRFTLLLLVAICSVSSAAGRILHQSGGTNATLTLKDFVQKRLSDECAQLARETPYRLPAQQCIGRAGDFTSRSLSPGLLNDEIPQGIFTEDCLNGCFVRTVPGPDKMCVCMNSTVDRDDLCNSGRPGADYL